MSPNLFLEVLLAVSRGLSYMPNLIFTWLFETLTLTYTRTVYKLMTENSLLKQLSLWSQPTTVAQHKCY